MNTPSNLFNPYRIKQVFTVWEAAAAIHGKYTIDEKDKAELQVTMNNLEYAICNKELPGEIAVDSEYPHFYLTTRDFWKGSEIKRADLEEWCDKNGLRPPLLFPDDTQPSDLKSTTSGSTNSSIEALHRMVAALVIMLASNCGNKKNLTEKTAAINSRYLKPDGKTINRNALQKDMLLVLEKLGAITTGVSKNSVYAMIDGRCPDGLPKPLPEGLEELAQEIIKSLNLKQ